MLLLTFAFYCFAVSEKNVSKFIDSGNARNPSAVLFDPNYFLDVRFGCATSCTVQKRLPEVRKKENVKNASISASDRFPIQHLVSKKNVNIQCKVTI